MNDLSAEEISRIAADAYTFGFPLVLLDVTRRVMLAEPGSDGGRQGMNRFNHRRAYPDASFTAVVSPNADTLYSMAFLSLAEEPLVLHVPESHGRYYLMPLMSAWTDVFGSPGSRTTGAGEGEFAIVGPRWQGQLPSGLSEIRSPTSMVMLIGRTQTNGKADYDAVHEFQDGLRLTPLSSWGEPSTAAAAEPAQPDVDLTTPPPGQVMEMDAPTFFDRLARLMVDNPPTEADAPAMARFAAIGLAPGAFTAGPEQLPQITEGMRTALAALNRKELMSAPPVNGWAVSRQGGTYGTDYLRRAAVAMFGLGANLAADAMYPHADVDSDGQALHGSRRYVLHFEPGLTPPCRAFWSLTMYDDQQYFVQNPLDRYAIGDRDPLAINDDGSLDIWLQHESPGTDRESNWLPAPAGAFNVMLRVYWPGPELVDGTWSPPGIQRRG